MARQPVTAGLVLAAAIAAFVLGGLLGQHFETEKIQRAMESERRNERVMMLTDTGTRVVTAVSFLNSGPSDPAREKLEELLYEHAFLVSEELQRTLPLYGGLESDARGFLKIAGEYYWKHTSTAPSPKPADKFPLPEIFAPYRPAGVAAPPAP